MLISSVSFCLVLNWRTFAVAALHRYRVLYRKSGNKFSWGYRMWLTHDVSVAVLANGEKLGGIDLDHYITMCLIIVMGLVILWFTCTAKWFKFILLNKRAPLLPFVCQIFSIHYSGNDDECCRKWTIYGKIQFTHFETAVVVLSNLILVPMLVNIISAWTIYKGGYIYIILLRYPLNAVYWR